MSELTHDPFDTRKMADPPELLTKQRRTYVQNDLPIRLQHELRGLMNDCSKITTYNGVREIGDRLLGLGREFRDMGDRWEAAP